MTAGVSIHHLTLNEYDVAGYRTFFRFTPPLRSEDDRIAMIEAVAEGLKALQLGDHRIQTVGEVGGVTYVDDSKATNPHAAASSMRAASVCPSHSSSPGCRLRPVPSSTFLLDFHGLCPILAVARRAICCASTLQRIIARQGG